VRARGRRTAEAIGEYRRAREILAVQLGLDPSPELQNFYAAVIGDSGDQDRAIAGYPACPREALEIYRRLGMPAAEQVTVRLAEIRACLPAETGHPVVPGA
jgi:hypothetical protein